jgi:hypothetical protein
VLPPYPPTGRIDRPPRFPVELIALLGALSFSACKVIPGDDVPPGLEPPDDTRAIVGAPDTLTDPASVDFLLSMDFREAALMAAHTMEMPPLFRVAATEISHPPLAPGEPLSAFSASGNVFLEIKFAEPLIALAQQADVSVREIILRGRPVLRRGQSVIEATAGETVFYLSADAIEIDGPHQLRRLGDTVPEFLPPGSSSLPDDTIDRLPEIPLQAPGNAPGAITIDPSQVPPDMTAEEIQRLISGQD